MSFGPHLFLALLEGTVTAFVLAGITARLASTSAARTVAATLPRRSVSNAPAAIRPHSRRLPKGTRGAQTRQEQRARIAEREERRAALTGD